MDAFGRSALLGLFFGFLWGIGFALAVMYSLYLAGYRKAVKESLKTVKPLRYVRVLERAQARRAKAKAKAKAKKASAQEGTETTGAPPSLPSSPSSPAPQQ